MLVLMIISRSLELDSAGAPGRLALECLTREVGQAGVQTDGRQDGRKHNEAPRINTRTTKTR